ncbi:MAG: dipeptidase [Pseudomonadales bacterium]|jgi:membrane dipeptidase|nr:dipeptidase [Pseudomonadales bacterium]
MNTFFSRSLLSLCCALPLTALGASEDDLIAQARAIHERVLTLDTHVDIPLNFATSEFMPADAEAQVNLNTMQSGGLDGAFFSVYVGQGARDTEGNLHAKADALAKFDAIHRMTDSLYSDRIGLATTAAEARALHAEGKLVALIGMENAYVIGQDLSLLADYRARGARYLTLVHNGHNDVGDSAQPQARFNDADEEHQGLSAFGYQVVDELNRLGILVDVSHVSKATMLAATAHSKAPVLASHSSARALFDHPRNMDDEQLLALKANGGVVQIVAFNAYLRPAGETATVQDLVNHIDHVVQLIGIDHVGISSDFGGGGGISGWNGAAETFNLTLELVRRGYSEADIAKIWSGNVLRILEQAERVAEGG